MSIIELPENKPNFKSISEVRAKLTKEISKHLYLSLNVEDLFEKLSTRTVNGLKKIIDYQKVGTVKDLVQMSEQELLKCKNFGNKSLHETKGLLSAMGLDFGTTF